MKDFKDFSIDHSATEKKNIGTCEGFEMNILSVPAALDIEFPQRSSSPPPPQFHGCNCDLLFRELAFKVSTLKVFHAWYHPLIEFKTDAYPATRSGDIALTPGCTDSTSSHATETDSGNEI